MPEATPAEMQAAVDAASTAYRSWSKTTILTRQQIMFKFQQLIKDNMVSGTPSLQGVLVLDWRVGSGGGGVVVGGTGEGCRCGMGLEAGEMGLERGREGEG